MTVQEIIEKLCDQNALVTVWKTKPDEYRCVIYPDHGYGDKMAAESDSVAGALKMVLGRLS